MCQGERGWSSYHFSELDGRERLRSYSWPGNVRELQSVLKRALWLKAQSKVLLAEHCSCPWAMQPMLGPRGTANRDRFAKSQRNRVVAYGRLMAPSRFSPHQQQRGVRPCFAESLPLPWSFHDVTPVLEVFSVRLGTQKMAWFMYG
jgi:transcriptional regulator with AAA-type ATPase domain